VLGLDILLAESQDAGAETDLSAAMEDNRRTVIVDKIGNYPTARAGSNRCPNSRGRRWPLDMHRLCSTAMGSVAIFPQLSCLRRAPAVYVQSGPSLGRALRYYSSAK